MDHGKKKKRSRKPKFDIYRKCVTCGKQYGDQNLDAHMHSYIHHEAVEHVNGSKQLHKCWACDVSNMSLEEYKEHIATRKHTFCLYNLHKRRKKQKVRVNYNFNLANKKFEPLQKELQKEEQKCAEICFVCCQSFPVQDLDLHMHSVFHHQVVEQLKGSPQVHKCWACDLSKTGMAEFKQHVRTFDHKYKMFELQKITADGENLDYSAEMDDELRALCEQRNEQLKSSKKTPREKKHKWFEAKLQKTQLSNEKKNTSKSMDSTQPVIPDEEFTNDRLLQSYHLFRSFEIQNDHSESVKLNQNLHERRQEEVLDMNRSNGPERTCLEKPSENLLKETSACGPTIPKTEGGTCAGFAFGPGRMETSKPKLTAIIGACSTQRAMTENEAVNPTPPLQKHTHSKTSIWKVNRAASESQQDATSEGKNRQAPNVNSLPSGTSLAEMFENQTSGNDCQTIEMVEKPFSVCVKKRKLNECETERGEKSLEHPNSFETNDWKNERKKQKKEKISRKMKVNKLITLSSKEDELNSSLEIVGDELLQAYSSLQSAYTEVQRLLVVKQQVTSEMASLRSKRIKILQDMKNPSTCSTDSDQQVGLNAS